eukprot:CAMPEP_0174356950 /NCGR_PEP_ID=MMETSP0811_2-20130205/32975_1 /TAXON_ID=73025 ORGANISM="Eutreptiella gymnastica-like, Strain CCMP1594" /NCGR_SAMPLE_ID=MMETSP0811_2 /ASSEMBLY_ACC=CAM_ASM_000667 /LENGTH=64 /DNA_ID=CAMNT_0015489311 /DNA_START=977 /DNA_END=1171 /DNA_ORIENTATION=+
MASCQTSPHTPSLVWGCPLGRPWPIARAGALLRVDPTQGSETGTVLGLRWHIAEGKEGCVGRHG